MTREEIRLGMHVGGLEVSSMRLVQGIVKHLAPDYVELESGISLLYSGLHHVAKPVAEFPHRCPRCGRPAYVGLRTVDHQYDVYKTGECP